MSLQPGTHLGPYEIIAPLGAGGMGEVYEAGQASLNRKVALEVLARSLGLTSQTCVWFRRQAEKRR